MKSFANIMSSAILALIMSNTASYSDVRDPSGDLTKYVMYGDEGITQAGSGETATNGFVGTGASYKITGSLKYNTTIKTEGSVEFGVGSYTDSVSYIEGNFTYSQYQYGYIADTLYYGGSLGASNVKPSDPLVFNSSNMVDPVNILPTSTVVNTNSNNCTYNGSSGSWSCSGDNSGILGDTLLPGNYGNISITGSNGGTAKFTAGTYEIGSFTTTQNFGVGNLNIDKSEDAVTRIIADGNVSLTNGGRIYTNSSTDLGKVLFYTNGDFTMNDGNEVSATIYAPQGTITAVSNTKVFGQLLAKLINITNNFNGTAGAFVGFDPVGVSLVGADTYEITESTDASSATRNSRSIAIPIALKAKTNVAASVDYEIRTITGTDTWGTGYQKAIVGTDSLTSDIVYNSYGQSPNTGTLNFNIGDSLPTSSISFYVVDDTIPEPTSTPAVGGLEYFALILDNATGIVLDSDPNAVFADGDKLIYLIPINSDDSPNLAPNAITTNRTSVDERSYRTNIKLRGVDPDGNNEDLVFTRSGGTNFGDFIIVQDSILRLADTAVYENSLGIVQDTDLEIEVTATDPGGATFSQLLTININNRNDEKPNANEDALTLAEAGTASVLVSSNDNDNLDGLALVGTYTIIGGGTYASSLSFTDSTLSYTHDGSENFLDTVWYELNDGGIVSSNQLDTSFVVITITQVNDNDPVLNSDTIEVSEDELNGFFIDTLQGTDLDGDALIFSVISQEHDGAFSITSDSVMTVADTDSVDYEIDSLHLMVVRVSDGSRTADVNIWVKILNVNDNTPTARDTSYTISEAILDNDVVGTFVSTDSDGDAISYSIIDQEYASTFKINNSGVIRILDGTNIDFENDINHTFKVIVNDGSRRDTANVVVNITDVNDNDPVLNDTTFNVNENEDNGFEVGLLIGSDVDASTLTYRLDSAQVSGAFNVSSTGSVTILDSSLVDYEVLQTQRLYVTILDQDNRDDSAIITININNFNDNSPSFNDTTLTMVENRPQGQSIATLIASDPDGSLNTLVFRIDRQDYNTAFTISNSGVLTLADSTLIDFESDPTHTLDVIVSDGTFEDTALVTINLINVNDGSPIYNDTTLAVDEGALTGTIISEHRATDSDGDPLTYSIISESITGMFEIDSLTSEITVLDGSLIDYESTTTVSIVVEATDGVNAITSTVTFNVANVNDNTPILNDTNFTMVEGLVDGFVIDTLIGTDADGSLNPLTYTLDSSKYSNSFSLSSEGVITIDQSSVIDYETDSVHVLYVTISDGTFSSEAIITLNITDANDNSPIYNDTAIVFNESLNSGESLGSHLATDVDGPVLSYRSINQDPTNTFTVTSSGEILILDELQIDYEVDSTLTLEIEVTDGLFFDTALVSFTLVNVNDNSPLMNDTNFVIDENAPNDFDLGTLIASDQDGDVLSFIVLNQTVTNAFKLSNAGQLQVQTSSDLDYESNSVHIIEVEVSDGLNSDTAFVMVNLNNLNDNTPVGQDTSFTVTEGVANLVIVGQVTGTDADNNPVTFSIKSQDHPSAFTMTSDGELSVSDSSLIDFETDTQHSLVVTITDGTTSSDFNVTINILDINDNLPVVADTNFTISELSLLGSVVGTVIGSDLDGNTLSFSIKSQEHLNAFSITSGGVIEVSNTDSIDYELDDQHSLILEITDNLFTIEANILINITDENDNLPQIADAAFTIDESVDVGYVVGSVTGTDGDGTSLVYELVSQEYIGAFQYSNTGVLTVLDSSLIDFESDDEHRLTVQVISGGDTAQASISVSILDANDNLPVTRDTTVSLSEDESLGRLIWTVPGEDLDVDDRATFEIISGNNENKFTLDSSSGRISLTSRLDYETTSSYTLSINVTSGGDVVASTLTINVVNVNVSPIITVDSLFIDENTLAGTEPIGTITGVDEDLTQIIWKLPNDSLSDNSLFVIDSLTGQLSLKQDSTINFEFKDTLQIVIAATDDSSSTFEFIEIIVGNVNDAPTIEASTIMVEENTPGGTIVGQVIADDEDFDAVLTYEIIDGDIFTIDNTTGEIILKSGETIDFEDKETYTFEVVVSDGEYSDTTEITISVENIVETATITVVEIFDDSGRTVENTQEFYTSHDTVTIVYDKDGVIDTVRVSVDEGINIINEINNDPTKDIFEEVDVKVVVSKVDPEFEVVITSEIPVDTNDLTHHVNDLEQDSIWVRITHVNQGLDTVYVDSLLAIDDFLVEGEVHEKVVVFEDVYGNLDSTTVRILLDTTFPILTILNPEDRSETDTLLLNVIWEVVDGVAIDTLADEQLVSSGTFAIIRSYSDFAGNVAADTVIVTVTADDTGAKIAVIDDVVNQKTTDELIEYFEERERTSDPAFDGVTLDTDGDGIPDIERANISVIMPNQSSNNNGKTTAIELAVQTDKGVIRREEEAEFVYDAAESKFGLNLELNFPINGGYTQDGRSRAGNIPDSLKTLCDPDSTMFTLRVERIQFHIFDHIGQYVSKINIDGFDVSDPRYQNDNGKVNLMMEIPQLADGLTSEAGENWGTGVYIMSGVVQTSSTPKECLQDINTLRRRTSSTSLMEEVGYKRENP